MRFLASLLLLLPLCVQAAAPATVSALQMPVWLERGGVRQPLALGAELQSGDLIQTGPGAQLILRLEEGSEIKLGEDAEFELFAAEAPASESEVFTATMNVLKGAFRFTTSVLGKNRKRNITANINTVTIGIRGTDVWGKATDASDFVVLIEGAIAVKHANEAEEHVMSTAMMMVDAPKSKDAVMTESQVDPAQMAVWAQETELKPGKGVCAPEGNWVVNAGEVLFADTAKQLMASLSTAGFAAHERQENRDGRNWKILDVGGYVSEADARYDVQRLRALGFPTARASQKAGAQH